MTPDGAKNWIPVEELEDSQARIDQTGIDQVRQVSPDAEMSTALQNGIFKMEFRQIIIEVLGRTKPVIHEMD